MHKKSTTRRAILAGSAALATGAAAATPPSHTFDHGTRRDKIRLLGNGVAPPVMKSVIETLTQH